MKVIDPGHRYLLHELDDSSVWKDPQELRFVKREGEGYPGNVGHYSGTTLQEIWRVSLDRLKYVDAQISCPETKEAILCLRSAILFLEIRAAKRHGRELKMRPGWDIENDPTCLVCGHIQCPGHGDGSHKS